MATVFSIRMLVGVIWVALAASLVSAQEPRVCVDAKYGYAVTPPVEWKLGDLANYSVPGKLWRAWTPDDVVSITVFIQKPEQAISAQQLLESNVKSLKKNGVEIREQKVEQIGGAEAMSLVLAGKGTGGALDNHGSVQTAQHWVAIPRGKEIIVFLLTAPEAELKANEQIFKAMLQTIKVEKDWVVIEKAANLDFESGAGMEGLPEHWGRCGQPDSPYQVSLDTKQPHEGKSSCRIEFTGSGKASEQEFAGCIQSMPAKPWLGKRVRYSGFLMTKDADGKAGLWMRVDGEKPGDMLAFDNMHNRAVTGTTKWKRFEVVLDVSLKAADVVFGALMSGTGDMWVDDLKFEEVGRDTPVTAMVEADQEWASRRAAGNLDFESGCGTNGLPKNWGRCGQSDSPYDVTLVEKGAHEGEGCCRISFAGDGKPRQQDFAGCMQSVEAKPWLGKRLRFSGFLKTKDVEGKAGLWMRVDGSDEGEMLAFDNMDSRPVTRTTKWKKFEVVLDVSPKASKVFFGALLCGRGDLWVDDLKFEEVGQDTPVTGAIGADQEWASRETAGNLDFELGEGTEKLPQSWGRCGAPDSPYKVALDTKGGHEGKGCCRIRFTGDGKPRQDDFAGCMQSVEAKPWLGKRVRYSGFLKTKDVEGKAGLWMRVDGPTRGKSLAFDNMYKRPVTGTTEWKRFEVVLDVPSNATKVFFGALLSGTGQTWVDDLKFEEVGQDTPTTGS